MDFTQLIPGITQVQSYLVHEEGSEADAELGRNDTDPALAIPVGSVELSHLDQSEGHTGRR